MKKTLIVLLVFLTMTFISATAADNTAVYGRVYGHWMMDMSDNMDDYNEFDVTRAYVTVKSKLSDYTSARITTDLRSADGYDGYSIILKYAYFDGVPFGQEKALFRLGLQPTMYFSEMINAWGHHYLIKTFGEENNFLTTSDLGATLFLKPDKEASYGYLGLALLNGTSYTDVGENNKHKDFNAFGLFRPFSNNIDLEKSKLMAQYYMGTQNVVIGRFLNEDLEIDSTRTTDDYKRDFFSFGGLLAYKDMVDLGFDMHFMTYGLGLDEDGLAAGEVKRSGMSFFTTLYMEQLLIDMPSLRTLNVFGRYDVYDPDTDVEDNGEKLLIVGVECKPVKGFQASLNYRSTSFEAEGVDSKNYFYLNTVVKF